jgi:aryl-alcohol dehydrogenase-like predicted oxidoreductase
MQKSNLGRTSIEVSKICLGTMTYGRQNTEKEAHLQMDTALEYGVNFFDTAEMYSAPPSADSQGKTEQYIGRWFKSSGKRDQVVLASKVIGRGLGIPWIREGQSRLNRTNIRAAIESSLQRLQTDYIDLYQLHWPDREMSLFGKNGVGYSHAQNDDAVAFEETLSALQELIDEGKIRSVGLSNESPWGTMKFLELAEQGKGPRMASIQNAFSLLNRSFEVGLAEIALREDCGLLAYAPLAAGTLSGKYLNGAEPAGARRTEFTGQTRYMTANSDSAVQAYVDLAKKHGIDPSQMALAFVHQQSFVTSTIIGATNQSQLLNALESIDLSLSDDLLNELNAIHQIYTYPCP